MQEITEKKCPKCNAIKPLGAFSKGEHGRFGHASYCKACMLEYHKKKQTDPLYRERQRRRGIRAIEHKCYVYKHTIYGNV